MDKYSEGTPILEEIIPEETLEMLAEELSSAKRINFWSKIILGGGIGSLTAAILLLEILSIFGFGIGVFCTIFGASSLYFDAKNFKECKNLYKCMQKKESFDIKLRPHHIFEFPEKVMDPSYGKEFIQLFPKYFPGNSGEKLAQAFESVTDDTKICIVPSLDIICEHCHKKDWKCYRPEKTSLISGVKVGNIYTFKQLKELYVKHLLKKGRSFDL